MKDKKNEKPRTLFILFISIVVLFFIYTSYKQNVIDQDTLVLFVYEDKNEPDKDEILIKGITLVSFNPRHERFHITKYPTYILMNSKSEEIEIISNEISDIKEYMNKR
ncbi:hypothetical protein [Paenibacillus sambharensis]|nr:hypothetical protein [Paenibacillus sambharensis]